MISFPGPAKKDTGTEFIVFGDTSLKMYPTAMEEGSASLQKGPGMEMSHSLQGSKGKIYFESESPCWSTDLHIYVCMCYNIPCSKGNI